MLRVHGSGVGSYGPGFRSRIASFAGGVLMIADGCSSRVASFAGEDLMVADGCSSRVLPVSVALPEAPLCSRNALNGPSSSGGSTIATSEAPARTAIRLSRKEEEEEVNFRQTSVWGGDWGEPTLLRSIPFPRPLPSPRRRHSLGAKARPPSPRQPQTSGRRPL